MLFRSNKILKNRNIVLKSEDTYKENLIDSIDKKMFSLQKSIIEDRKNFFERLNIILLEKTKQFLGNKKLQLKYESFIDLKSEDYMKEIKERFTASRRIDFESKTTQKGVHKEDWKMLLNGKDISSYASQGEQRMASIIFITTLLELKEESILLLDDVYFELSNENKDKVTKSFENISQVFLTTCDLNSVPIDNFKDRYEIFNLNERKDD